MGGLGDEAAPQTFVGVASWSPNWTRPVLSVIIGTIVTDYTTHPDSIIIRVIVRKTELRPGQETWAEWLQPEAP